MTYPSVLINLGKIKLNNEFIGETPSINFIQEKNKLNKKFIDGSTTSK